MDEYTLQIALRVIVVIGVVYLAIRVYDGFSNCASGHGGLICQAIGGIRKTFGWLF